MGRALDLARQGMGLTSPNPMVGAVLVQDDRIVGEGFHRYTDGKHAEILAIEQAGERVRGATLYVNLEPCSHVGRTGPCCDLIVRSGIRRVVAAIQDPNPLVAGAGFKWLADAGIELALGIKAAEAGRLNEAYLKYITTRRPFVTLKAGVTLDGKIADRNGHSQWITSQEARQKAHDLRFESDAILVGVGTVLMDDPTLTDRSGRSRHRRLLRVLMDSSLRLPMESKLLRSRNEGDIILFCSEGRDLDRQGLLEEKGIEVVPAPPTHGKIQMDFVLQQLGYRQITSLLVEGGAEVNFEALRSQVVDKVIFFAAPKILGGKEAVPVVGGEGFQNLRSCLPLRFATVEKVGTDLMIEAYVERSSQQAS